MNAFLFWCIFSFSFSVLASHPEEIAFRAGENSTLHARLYLAKSTKSKRPAVLILEGFGKNIPAVPYDQLALQLSQQGYLVLTYNRRGTGENADHGSVWKSTFTSDSQDAQFALNFLKSHPKVDPKKVFIIGHCLGGAQALKLTEKNEVAGVILVASTLRNIRDLQLESHRIQGQLLGWNKKKVDESVQALSKQIQEVKAGSFKCAAPQCMIKDGVEVVHEIMPLPWWEEVLKLDITEWALNSKAPVYFIFGSSDYLSTKTDYYFVRDVIRINKTHHLKARILPELDHFLVDNKSALESLKYSERLLTSADSKPVSKELVGEISTWLRHH